MISQQGDVYLFNTPDDGDILVADGIVEMSGGLETSAYLSLFGGNEEDAGNADSRANWWGNLDEGIASRIYRSETQNLIQALPATSGNLRRVESAATRDLAWLVEENAATEVLVDASIPAVNTLRLEIAIIADDRVTSLQFTENWKVEI